MSPDPDGDSQMLSSSPDVSDVETTPPAAALSPPSSQSRTMPIVSAGLAQLKGAAGGGGSSIANSNGKRPLNTISNGLDDPEDGTTIGNTTSSSSSLPSTRSKNQQALGDYSPPSQQQTKTHAASGYSWGRAEDEPGWAWLNPKAADEAARAWETLVHRDAMVKNRLGDVFELARRTGHSPASLAG